MKTLDTQIRPTVALLTDDDPEDIGLDCDKDFYEGALSRFPLELNQQQ